MAGSGGENGRRWRRDLLERGGQTRKKTQRPRDLLNGVLPYLVGTGPFASLYANTNPDNGPAAAADVENSKVGRTGEL
jgi:hypothetical protein